MFTTQRGGVDVVSVGCDVMRLMSSCVRRRMTFHVQSEVIGAREGVLAHAANVRFVSSVLAMVATQLVRTGELPFATRPCTAERLLACTRTLTKIVSESLRCFNALK